jgi:hypothetical protein
MSPGPERGNFGGILLDCAPRFEELDRDRAELLDEEERFDDVVVFTTERAELLEIAALLLFFALKEDDETFLTGGRCFCTDVGKSCTRLPIMPPIADDDDVTDERTPSSDKEDDDDDTSAGTSATRIASLTSD